MTDKQKYYRLLAEVCEILPLRAPTVLIRAGYKPDHMGLAVRLQHVKQGKVADLNDLIAMIELTMPDYEIPAHLRPDGVTA